MIFATVGTHNKGFDRLVRMVDSYARSTSEKIIIQIGASEYIPEFTGYFRFENQDAMENYYRKSILIITHAGAGSLITAVKLSKPLVVVPRLKKYNEALDNHQLQLASFIKAKGFGEIANSLDDLQFAIEKTHKLRVKKKPFGDIAFFLKEYLHRFEVSVK